MDDYYVESLKEGRRYFRQGDFEKARKIFSDLRKKFPHRTEAYIGEGNVLENQGRFREAKQLYEEALIIAKKVGSDQGYSDALVSRGRVKILISINEKGALDEESVKSALRDFDEAIALRPNDYWPYSEKATLLLSLKRFDEAWSVFEKALERNVNDPETYLRAGICLGCIVEGEKDLEPFLKANKLYRAISLLSMGFSEELSPKQLEDYRIWREYLRVSLNEVLGKY
ncbi:MAG: tetratricopeptide repeat protein [Candidatus Bathyarchaeia archaeon]